VKSKVNNHVPLSAPTSPPAIEVNADGSVAIRPKNKVSSASSKNKEVEQQPSSPRRNKDKLDSIDGGGAIKSPRSESARKKKRSDVHSEDKVNGGGGSSSSSSSPRSSPRKGGSRRTKSSKPPPPPPPPEEPPPPAKWDWEDKPIVSKVSTQLREEIDTSKAIPSPSSSSSLPKNITEQAKTQMSASWLEHPYGNPNSRPSSSNGVGNGGAGGLSSPRISPRPSSSRTPTLSPRIGGGGSGSTPGSAPGSAPGKISDSRARHDKDELINSPEGSIPYDVANEYGMNAMLRELHLARQSRRKSDEDISNMHTMAVNDDDSNDFDNGGGWKEEKHGYDEIGGVGTMAVAKQGRPRSRDHDKKMVDSNELIMDHDNHHQKVRRPSPWRAPEQAPPPNNHQPKSPRFNQNDMGGGGGGGKLGGGMGGRGKSKIPPVGGGGMDNNYKNMLHDAKEINKRDPKGAHKGGLGIDHSSPPRSKHGQLGGGGGSGGGGGLDDAENRLKNRRKKPAPTPASGAVPLNVKNARRNAGDGDDHFPEDGSVANSNNDKGVKKGRGDGTRQNFDKRTSRMKNARHFKGAIDGYRNMKRDYFHGNNHDQYSDDDDDDEDGNGHARESSDGLVKVFVRKRPMFEYEAARGEFDVISIVSQDLQRQENHHGQHGSGYKGCKVLIHNCVMHPDMKRMYHKACWFPAHHAFGESATNPGVFNKCAMPLVKAVASGDGVGTLFMYGQTGSGKTHTMTGIEEGVSMALSGLIHSSSNASHSNHILSNESVKVRLRFFELVGKRCVDLIAPKAGVELKLMNDGNDAVRPAGAAEPIVDDASHLLALLKLGKKRRATAPTDVNGGSSRSHAVCQIEVIYNKSKNTSGLLTLVDCAGSERKEDSMYHDKERQRESTEINASLYALKECVRARALAAKGKNVQIPFRSSSLTKVLMESFVRTDAYLAVIATVSPIPTDTEHSISTLRTVCAIAGYNDSDMIEEKQEVKPNLPKREERIPPIKWTSDQLFAWVRTVSNGRFATVANDLPKGTSGKVVMRWGAAQFSAICGGPKIGGALQRLLQEERARFEQLEQLKRQDRLG